MMRKRILAFSVLLVLLICVFAGDEDPWERPYVKLTSIISRIEEGYFKDITASSLVEASIKGMIQTLDPHSYFLNPRRLEYLREESGGKYYGLGILIQKHHTRLVVIAPLEGTPAYRLGLQPGDVIAKIDGESTEEISSFDAMQKLRGPKGTEVTITIVRDGLEESFDLTIKRAEIPLHSVRYAFMLNEDVGYIYVRNFAVTTADEIEEKIWILKNKGMKKLILDFRDNGGGTFTQSIEVADAFLPRDARIVSIKGRNSSYNQEFFALRDGQFEDLPLIILINEGTASAPEIVSGAIKDNDRGLIIGENSFGKGLVQTVFLLSDEAALALTTAKYFTPSGRSIQRDFTSYEDYYVFRPPPPEEDREVSFTANGRMVLGQGGIAPDYEVEFSFMRATGDLLLRGAFFNYGRRFVEKKTPLSKKAIFPGEKTAGALKDGQWMIDKNMEVDGRIIQDFKLFLKEKKIKYSEKDFDDALDQIKRELKRELFSSIWTIEDGVKAHRQDDRVVQKALEMFSEAMKMASHPRQ